MTTLGIMHTYYVMLMTSYAYTMILYCPWHDQWIHATEVFFSWWPWHLTWYKAETDPSSKCSLDMGSQPFQICCSSCQELWNAPDQPIAQPILTTPMGWQPVSLQLLSWIGSLWPPWPRMLVILSIPYWCDEVDGWALSCWHCSWGFPLSSLIAFLC